jgi:uncharacterized protein YndB with AHSA1/START domain
MSASDPRDFARELTIPVPPRRVFAALSTLEGLAGWWTPLVAGSPTQGGTLTFRFAGLAEEITMRVATITPPTHIAWTCERHTGHPEWAGTTITFDLEPAGQTGSLLSLRHEGLLPLLNCYDTCASGWEKFLTSIAAYAESGHGRPFRGASQTP